MLSGMSPGGPPPPPTDLIKDTDTQNFMADVIDASREVPVIVDFWAPWCGPCKQLTPVLEKVVTGARGKAKLVKLNIDENQQIAQQMRIQSIPAVFAFVDGRPVDGFMGALPESQVKAFVDRLAAGGGPSPVDDALEQAGQLLEGGDPAQAAQIYAAVLEEDQGNAKALAGLARCYLANNDAERAAQTLALVPPEAKSDPDVLSVEAQLQLVEQQQAGPAAETAPLLARIEANPKDHEARFELAQACLSAGQEEEAIDALLEIVRRDRAWNEEAARKQLLTIFEALGPKHELTLSGRRQLSSILFS